MTEFERDGHWRETSDGTRTWVTGHEVRRKPQSKKRPYADIDLDRLQARATKPNKKRRKKSIGEIAITKGAASVALKPKSKAKHGKRKLTNKIVAFRNF